LKKNISVFIFLKKLIFKSDFSKKNGKTLLKRIFGPERALAVDKKATPGFLTTPRSHQVALRPVAPLVARAYGAIAAHYGPESLKNRQICLNPRFMPISHQRKGQPSQIKAPIRRAIDDLGFAMALGITTWH
jgi:hypothetical protein